MTRHFKSRRGGSVLEAAIVLPVLILLSFGTVEYGYYFYVRSCFQNAAHDGVRVAALPAATNAQVSDAIANALKNTSIKTGTWTWSVTDIGGNPVNVALVSGGTDIQVIAKGNWGNVGVKAIGLISSTKVVSGMAVMRKEGISY